MRLVHSDQDIKDTFTPWHADPKRLARLWRWLVLLDQAPSDPAYFMENALEWQQEWEDLAMWSGTAA
jgi:hypothetical protein